MLLRRLSMSNVRATGELSVEVGPALTILVGPNGAGKTSVLEAVALALGGTQLRAGAMRDMITHARDHLRVEVELEEEGRALTACAAHSRQGDRRLTADGLALTDHSRWRESIPVRTFVPDDLRLIKGSPRRRRIYLDSLAAARDPGYAVLLRDYEEALTQRNSLLRGRTGGDEETQFSPWEQILAETGLAVGGKRAAALGDFIQAFQDMHRDLTGEPVDAFRLTYRTNVAGLDEDAYRDRLRESRPADRQRTFTHLGPHRDDFRLTRAGLDMRECASQGEQRAALLTLVLAEWDQLRESGPSPLLLLDDVMSELDEHRRRSLVKVVSRGGQVLMTTTDLRYFADEELAAAEVVEMRGGTYDGRA